MMHYGINKYMNPFFMGFPGGFAVGLLILILLTAFLIYMIRKGSSVKQADNALDILRTLYAKGEITMEEFENRKSVLKNT